MITHKGSIFTIILVVITSMKCEVKLERRLDNTSSYVTCTKSFSEDKFIINLPKNNEISPFECKFYVNPSSPDVCRLKLNFKQFTLRSSPSCRDQFFRVGGQRLCGSILGPQTIPFTQSQMILHYRGDGEHSLLVEVDQERCKFEAPLNNNCDVTSSQLQTVISSANFSNHYPTPLACIYKINPNSQNICQLDIKFNHFQLPESENCSQTRLLLDGKPYCGQKNGLNLFSQIKQPTILEYFSADPLELSNFEIAINQIECDKSLKTSGNLSAQQFEFPPQFPPLCCNRVFNSRNFILTSPGFLDLVVPNLNCVYQIVRSSPSVCRLKISFLHFWLGQEDVFYGCTDGFLEIDGRRICGCKDGLVFHSYYVGERKDLWLNMRGLRGKGFVIEITQEDCRDFRSRSVPEEITENPNTEVEVFSTNSTVEKIQSRFFVPSDDSRCHQWGLPHWLDNIHALLRQKSGQCPAPPLNSYLPLFPSQNPIHPSSCSPHNPIIPPLILPNPQPPFIPQFPTNPQPPLIPPQFPPNPQPPIIPPQYPPNPQPPIIPPQFPPNPRPPIIPPQFPPNPQPPIIPPQFPPNPRPPIIPPQFPPNPQPPIIPPQFPPNPQPPIIPPQYPPNPQPPIISPQFPPNPRPPIIPPQFPPNPQPPIIPLPFPPNPLPPTPPCQKCPQPPSRQCQIFSSLQGNFQSPGYPWKYPAKLNCCYRFQQLPGYCSLQVSFLDFDICWSPKCWKDFLLLDQNARYCGRSLQSSAAFVPFRRGFASIDFITDDFLSSRGFRAVFRQIPCLQNPFLPRSDSQAPNELEYVTKAPTSTTTEFSLNVSPKR